MSVDVKFLREKQLENCFVEEKLNQILSMKEVFNARKMIILCESDLLGVAKQIKYYISKKCSIFLGVDVYNTASADMPKEDKPLNLGEPDSPCILGLSLTGEEDSLCSKIEDLTKKRAMTIAVTFDENSRLAKVAKRQLILKKSEDFETNYYSIIVGLTSIMSRISEVKGYEPEKATLRWKEAMNCYLGKMDNLDACDSVKKLKEDLNTKPYVEFVTDEYTCELEYFLSSQLAKKVGIFTSFVDCEDWCHVNYFYDNPNDIVTVFFINKESASYGRILETMGTAVKINRTVYAICSDEFCMDKVTTIVMPEIAEGSEWMKPLLEGLAIDAALKGDK